MNKMNQFICFSFLTLLSLFTGAYAESNNFNCPQPSEIQLANLTTPSIWIGPPVTHSRPSEVGVGLGGKKVGEFIAAEPIIDETDPSKAGWVCVYKTQENSLHAYEESIKKAAESLVGSNPLLKHKYMKSLDGEFKALEEKRQPFMKKYADQSVGFLRYHFSKQAVKGIID